VSVFHVLLTLQRFIYTPLKFHLFVLLVVVLMSSVSDLLGDVVNCCSSGTQIVCYLNPNHHNDRDVLISLTFLFGMESLKLFALLQLHLIFFGLPILNDALGRLFYDRHPWEKRSIDGRLIMFDRITEWISFELYVPPLVTSSVGASAHTLLII